MNNDRVLPQAYLHLVALLDDRTSAKVGNNEPIVAYIIKAKS